MLPIQKTEILFDFFTSVNPLSLELVLLIGWALVGVAFCSLCLVDFLFCSAHVYGKNVGVAYLFATSNSYFGISFQ